MKKIKNNQGHTIPIVIVIIIVLSIITSSVVYAVNTSSKKAINKINNYTEKLVSENTTYLFLNDVLENNVLVETQDYLNHQFTITLIENNVYSFIIKNESNFELNATIEFTNDSYQILKWGFLVK